MEPSPYGAGQLILPEQAALSVYLENRQDFSAVLTATPAQCAAATDAVQGRAAVGMVVSCLAEPDSATPRPTEALIARYKAQFRQGMPNKTNFLYLRNAESFAALRCAVLAATDVAAHPIMAELAVAQDGLMPLGTDIVAAVGVLQRIGVSTVVVRGESAQDVSDALARCAPYARISLGARVDSVWLSHGIPFPNAEVFLPRRAEDIAPLCAALRTYHIAPPVPREHDDFLLAPDGVNAHFLDSLIDISDEIEVGSRLSERLLEAEDDAGALKLQFDCEEDLAVFEEQAFMVARPVCLCAEQPELLEAALRIYPGRALYDGTWPLDARLAKYFSEKYGMICL